MQQNDDNNTQELNLETVIQPKLISEDVLSNVIGGAIPLRVAVGVGALVGGAAMTSGTAVAVKEGGGSNASVAGASIVAGALGIASGASTAAALKVALCHA